MPVGQVVSRFYRGWDTWADATGSGVCPACVWGFRSPLLRSLPHWIHRAPHMLTPVRDTDLTDLLHRPLSNDESLVVPLHPSRRHLIHLAQWGCITTDDTTLVWDQTAADRFATYTQLRNLGIRDSHLTHPTPPWTALQDLTVNQIRLVLQLWPLLHPWRTSPAWMRLAARTAHPERSHT
ncbi:hypothetical protein [Luteococcus sp.]|uniref:hypothetical protein n=1 Tax=Luteococcus sp. TaxID=1969402 RepID=UPI0037360718